MDRVYLQWNLPNWITVFLMAGIGVVFLQFVVAGVKQYRAQ